MRVLHELRRLHLAIFNFMRREKVIRKNEATAVRRLVLFGLGAASGGLNAIFWLGSAGLWKSFPKRTVRFAGVRNLAVDTANMALECFRNEHTTAGPHRLGNYCGISEKSL